MDSYYYKHDEETSARKKQRLLLLANQPPERLEEVENNSKNNSLASMEEHCQRKKYHHLQSRPESRTSARTTISSRRSDDSFKEQLPPWRLDGKVPPLDVCIRLNAKTSINIRKESWKDNTFIGTYSRTSKHTTTNTNHDSSSTSRRNNKKYLEDDHRRRHSSTSDSQPACKKNHDGKNYMQLQEPPKYKEGQEHYLRDEGSDLEQKEDQWLDTTVSMESTSPQRGEGAATCSTNPIVTANELESFQGEREEKNQHGAASTNEKNSSLLEQPPRLITYPATDSTLVGAQLLLGAVNHLTTTAAPPFLVPYPPPSQQQQQQQQQQENIIATDGFRSHSMMTQQYALPPHNSYSPSSYSHLQHNHGVYQYQQGNNSINNYLAQKRLVTQRGEDNLAPPYYHHQQHHLFNDLVSSFYSSFDKSNANKQVGHQEVQAVGEEVLSRNTVRTKQYNHSFVLEQPSTVQYHYDQHSTSTSVGTEAIATNSTHRQLVSHDTSSSLLLVEGMMRRDHLGGPKQVHHQEQQQMPLLKLDAGRGQHDPNLMPPLLYNNDVNGNSNYNGNELPPPPHPNLMPPLLYNNDVNGNSNYNGNEMPPPPPPSDPNLMPPLLYNNDGNDNSNYNGNELPPPHPHHEQPPATVANATEGRELLLPYQNRRVLPLATSEDENRLSKFLCFVRSECIEVFKATAEDVAVRMNSRKVLLNQVGFRCRFCAHFPARERSGRSSCFPSSKNRIYQSLTMMIRDHFPKCHEMPLELKGHYMCLKANSSQGAKDSKIYWIDSADLLGLIDTPASGIRLVGQT